MVKKEIEEIPSPEAAVDGTESKIDDDYASSYFPPLIFVPQVPLIPVDGQSRCASRHSSFGNSRCPNNRSGQLQYYGRCRKRKRFWSRPNLFHNQLFSVRKYLRVKVIHKL